MALKFIDVPVISLLNQLSVDYGFEIVQPEIPSETRVTVISQQPMTPEGAISLLNAALKSRGYVAILNGRILRVLTRQHAQARRRSSLESIRKRFRKMMIFARR